MLVYLSILLSFVSLSFDPDEEAYVPIAEKEVCLSSEETKLYEMIMAYRKKKGLKPIPFSAKLTQVAQVHAKDLSNNYQFDPSNKCNPHSWSEKGKWTACCYTADHAKAQCMWDKPKEISGYLGAGYEIAYYSSKGANAAEGLKGWQESKHHNPLLINTGTWKQVEWGAIGIGIYGEYGVVWFGQEKDESKMLSCPN